jgi:hypothetical protein
VEGVFKLHWVLLAGVVCVLCTVAMGETVLRCLTPKVGPESRTSSETRDVLFSFLRDVAQMEERISRYHRSLRFSNM